MVLHLLYISLTLALLGKSFSWSFVKQNKKCRVLALEGGGDRGAYQAGVIKAFTEILPNEEVQWDVITGISIGSINAGLLGMYEKGNETQAGIDLLNNWRNISSNNVYNNWPYLGPIYGMMFENSIFNTMPGHIFLNNTFSKYSGLKRDIVFGATNVKTGEYDTYTNKDIKSTDNLTEVLLNSAAVPFFFPLQKYEDRLHMDGGVKFSLDISSGVNNCKDKGFKEEDIEVDVVLCFNITAIGLDPEKLNPFTSLCRAIEIFIYDFSARMIEEASMYLGNVTIRHVVGRSKVLPTSIIPLNFRPDQIEEMISLGIKDGKTIIQKGTTYTKNYIQGLKDKRAKQFENKYRFQPENDDNKNSSMNSNEYKPQMKKISFLQ